MYWEAKMENAEYALRTDRNTEEQGLRILVVDDNEPSAKTMGWMLEMLGHQVAIAHEGLSAIEKANAFIPDAVLLDIGLPGMNGYDVCRRMREMPALRHTVFIAQTGWGQKEHRELAREAGFAHHLVKPVDIEALKKALASVPARGEGEILKEVC